MNFLFSLSLVLLFSVAHGGGGHGDGECGEVTADEHYDKPLHIGAIFILLVTSFAGALLPLVVSRTWANASLLLSCGKLFGSGVILSTAFVHMFSHAVESLTNKCLSATFTENYTVFAGLFALVAVMSVHLLQVMASVMVQDQLQAKRMSKMLKANESHPSAKSVHDLFVVDADQETALTNNPYSSTGADGSVGVTAIAHTHGHDHDKNAMHAHGDADAGHAHAILFDARIEKRIGMYILELGIASHSVIIGIALGVESEKFRTLLIALVFHQFFEGIALATVILEAEIRSRVTVFAMLLLYSLTTPTGVAIGVGIHETYSDSDTTTLLVQGTLDSVSAGILIYDALVNIIVPHFACPLFRQATPLRRAAQLAAFWLGAGLMSVLGQWA